MTKVHQQLISIEGTNAEEELSLLDYVGAWTQFTCVE